MEPRMEIEELDDREYRPIPDNLEVRDSEIEGQGLFVNKGYNLTKGQRLGLAHLDLSELDVAEEVKTELPQKTWRSPMVSFVNHDDSPNCKVVWEDNVSTLYATRDVPSGEELTLDYSLGRAGSQYVDKMLASE